ncbi:valyl-tRNA synthetase [Negativicoccus succinicivorans]|uniref:Valine--tRNA ligase n=1 Tax=Negativicoccus succinicivorans TaxID=620903 RepID=A0A841R383_9FIRM|nr:valine--tRNA ligase [Negativicoccus succinicivorans]MBB6477298.1 valyl-tRNA synthetase [Negativicoccus succinicivorans]MDU1055765.1 valine--tRNA ligase [Negativicoccus succinicivorans]
MGKYKNLTSYNPAEIEQKWYQFWEENGVFHEEPKPGEKSYSIVLPPPNVTGQLHMGHALDDTLQDVLIRFKRMQGYNTLWLPGKDHAGIATQIKVEEELAKEGLTRDDLGREAFVERVWEWKEKFGDRIGQQIRRLGASCDWSRERFTLDEGCSKAVREVFVSLYEKGLIYRGFRITNWCPRCMTALSDIEVEYEDEAGKLYYVNYPLVDGNGYIQIATTRPETMLGDTGIAVHPEDERYAKYIGKKVIVPLADRKIEVVADSYVEPEFGTGAVKITPAHDPNDFEMGERHQLESIVIMNPNGTLNENAGAFNGMERYAARKAVVEALRKKGLLVKIEDADHAVGHCSRCHTTIEPLATRQWFVKMEPLTKPALQAVEEKRTEFVPPRFTQTYTHWLENIRDWCISRQLWWGHQIPAWYCNECGETIVSREDITTCPHCGGGVTQDPDVLDTWFSSALWPFSTMGWPDQTPELKQWYPTNTLVTGYDIIFFWVARMMFTGLEFMEEAPFKHVFIHGLVRDSQGRKMSKSLGNGIDPLEVINEYGADALRFTLMTGNTPGNDMRFYMERVEANRNFANKIWNAAKFVLMNLEGYEEKHAFSPEELTLADRWILERLAQTEESVTANLEKFELGEAAGSVYEFIWNIFCDWYIEAVKPRLYADDNASDRAVAQSVLVYVLTRALALLHPFMPFVTEHIWQHLPHEGLTLAKASWPTPDPALRFADAAEQMDRLMDAIKAVRNLRAEADIAPSQKVPLLLRVKRDDLTAVVEDHPLYFEKLANTSAVNLLANDAPAPENALTAITDGLEIYVKLADVINVEKENVRIQAEEDKLHQEVARLEKKLGNESFVTKAPAAVVAKEREKLANYNEKLATLMERRAFLATLAKEKA